jgi:Tol biopolymer transport system component
MIKCQPLNPAYILVSAGLLLALVLLALPVSAQEAPLCFDETGYCIDGRIREFWQQNGGLPVFGYPTTPQREEVIEGQPLQVQWFQRNRLELHPENAPPYDVQLGRLGDDVLLRQGRSWWTFPKSQQEDGCLFFEETGHSICGLFLEQWQSQGIELDGVPGISTAESLALFGLPISPLQVERLSDGNEYQVQWYERARFEIHPENPPASAVLLGLLGNEYRELPEVAQDPPEEPAPAPEEPPPPPDDPAPAQGVARLAFHSQRNGTFDIYTMNYDGTNFTQVTQSEANDAFPTWSPDGSRIAFVSDRTGNFELYVMNSDGSNVTQLTNHPANERSPDWSPDGRWITFYSDRGENMDIYVVTADGQELYRLTDEGTQERYPVWSPDSSRIVYASNLDGNDFDIYSMNIDGSDKRRLTNNTANDAYPTWSPDGSRIAFASGRDDNWELYVMNADGSEETRLTEVAEADLDPSWAPDGRHIAFESYRDNNWELYLLNLDTMAQTRLTNHPVRDASADWAP